VSGDDQTYRDRTISEFVAELASSAPVPGGGAASALSGAFAAALVRMVVALSVDKPKYAAYDATLRAAGEVATGAQERLLGLADEDAAAYARLAAAFKMPRDTAEEQGARQAAIRSGARDAALAPFQVLQECWDVLAAAESVAGRSNVNARSDASTAASLAEAAARGAAANVLINLPLTADETFNGETSASVVALLEQVTELADRAREAAATDELRDPEPEAE
jgi:formiminotetrahydrofolate cyclodeaminase